MPTGLIDCIVHFFMFFEELLVMVHLDALQHPDALPYHDALLHHDALPYHHMVQHYYAIQDNVSGFRTVHTLI